MTAYVAMQAVITMALLAFVFALRDESTTNLVVGATVAFWLRESVHLGQQAAARWQAGHWKSDKEG